MIDIMDYTTYQDFHDKEIAPPQMKYLVVC